MDSFVDFVRSNGGLLAGILGLLLLAVTNRDRSRPSEDLQNHNDDLTPESLYGGKVVESYSRRRAKFYLKASVWLGTGLVCVYGVASLLDSDLLENWLFRAIILVLGPMVVIYLFGTAVHENSREKRGEST